MNLPFRSAGNRHHKGIRTLVDSPSLMVHPPTRFLLSHLGKMPLPPFVTLTVPIKLGLRRRTTPELAISEFGVFFILAEQARQLRGRERGDENALPSVAASLADRLVLLLRQ
jgi:hypothetical protein